MMGKRSQRRALRYENDQAGCMWGLISIFDFRYGRSTRKLLSARRLGSRNAAGSSGVGTKLKMLTNSDQKLKITEKESEGGEESEMQTADVVKTCVKELMEEEMFSEQDSKKRTNTAQLVEPEETANTESCSVSARNSGAENSYHKVSEQKTLDNLDLEGIMEELFQYHQRNTSYDLDTRSSDAFSLAEENLSAAINVFTDQRFNEDAKTHHSKEFVDALKTLSSNKELFLKLLKDPNSPLVKQIQGIDDARLAKEQSNSRTEEHVNGKHRSFFKRRSKSQESNPLKGNEKSQPSNRIVILKPGPTGRRNPNTEMSVSTLLQSHDNVEDKASSERNHSQFSFTEIKRKLKHAMGKEKLENSRNLGMSEKGVLEERVGWSSPNRNHFYTEKFAKPNNAGKREEKIGKFRDTENSGYPKQGVSNIYIEAKKHLSDVLTNGDEKEAMTRQLPKTLGRILSLPEYNFSPWGSPGKDGEPGFVTAQMRLSPRGNFLTQRLIQQDDAVHLSSSSNQEVESQSGIINDNPDEKAQSSNSCSSVTDGLNLGNLVEENPLASSVNDETSFEGGVEMVAETEYQQEIGVLDVLCEVSSSIITSDDQNCNTTEVCDGERSSSCLKLDSCEEDPSFSSPLVSPSSSSQTKKIEDDRTERPSPVSILEPLFSDDEISPSNTKSRPAIQPIQIHFDEAMCTRACVENEESAFEYVEAVLLASGLNWDEYLSNQLSSDQLLHPSLFDEVELFSNRSCDDQKLLFDCTNEVLKEVCERYFGYSFVKHKIRPVPNGTSFIQEVWEGVEWHLLYYPPPHSLEQLVQKDMAKSGTWMDLGFETENIVIELINLVLEEMMEETIFSFVNDSMEGEFSVLRCEISEDE